MPRTCHSWSATSQLTPDSSSAPTWRPVPSAEEVNEPYRPARCPGVRDAEAAVAAAGRLLRVRGAATHVSEGEAMELVGEEAGG